ncbi:MAG: thiamine pyrophosphate-dependent enzyme, partial [Actinomycetota bacterium]
VLFCQNNAWAISVRLEEQTAGPIFKRAEGYGFPGVRVDGNDVLAVYTVTKAAADRARAGDGPTLIEAMTYRMGPHSTADDATRYRSSDEVNAWRKRDPIDRYLTYLLAAGVAEEAFVADCEDEAKEWVADIRTAITSVGPPPADELFAFAYGDPPEALERDRRSVEENGDG